MKQYLIDNQEADMNDIIEKAKGYGYSGDSYGVYFTSGAAKVLREHGHTVEENAKNE